ncbi:hypothetical protein E2542_SST06941 [Spatholobus suberectus]|nr:hypothetical protein E2542_SST06941 [Spatholobus suberectus]
MRTASSLRAMKSGDTNQSQRWYYTMMKQTRASDAKNAYADSRHNGGNEDNTSKRYQQEESTTSVAKNNVR